MEKRILITGGAGFIGSHLADRLINEGYSVRLLDNLSEQVHGREAGRPGYLHPLAELITGDVRNRDDVENALDGTDLVFHFAARVGVGQSMYEIGEYTSVNNLGTAVLLEAIIRKPVEKLIVASSMSIYGEGSYRNGRNEIIPGHERELADLKKGIWELHDENRQILVPVSTGETKPPTISSVYALSKFDQERMCLICGRAYNIPVTALRFFNVYGTRQSLSNPYTGVLAIFASRYLNDNPPLIFEDGNQMRDFVHVNDVVDACMLAAGSDKANGQVFNIGSGEIYTVAGIASELASVMRKPGIKHVITGKYRSGDIRHCFADIAKARKILGYSPSVSLREGLQQLTEWLGGQIALDYVENAGRELEERGLAIGRSDQ